MTGSVPAAATGPGLAELSKRAASGPWSVGSDPTYQVGYSGGGPDFDETPMARILPGYGGHQWPADAAFIVALVNAWRDGELVLRSEVEDAFACPHDSRHYYAVDALCQRCDMPSWVEALVRTTLDKDGSR